MGGKASNFMQSDRPESGGANKDDIKDKTGQHEQDKQKLESQRAELEASAEGLIPQRGENPEQARLKAERSKARGESDEE